MRIRTHQFTRCIAAARSLRAKGQYHEAEAVFRAIVTDSQRVLGPEHPVTLHSRNELAVTLYEQGDYDEAEAELRAILAMRERVLGPEHRDTLQSRIQVCKTVDDHRAVLAIQQRVLGPGHPDTLTSQENLAKKLYRQSKDPEAEVEFRAVLAIRERVLGPEHPGTLGSRLLLAFILDGLGKHAEAEAEYRAILAIRERALGPEHAGALEVRCCLAMTLEDEGKYTEAEAEYRAVLAIRERVLGLEHFQTKITRQDLNDVLRKGARDRSQQVGRDEPPPHLSAQRQAAVREGFVRASGSAVGNRSPLAFGKMETAPTQVVKKKRQKPNDVRIPKLKDDVGFLLCGSDGDGGHIGLTDGDYLIVLCGNSKGFRKLGKYFTALADLDTSDSACFHHHFFQVRSLSDTKIELMVRKHKAAIWEC